MSLSACNDVPTMRALHPEYKPVIPLVFRVSRMIVRGGSL